jgi:uncharacterized membrane protein
LRGAASASGRLRLPGRDQMGYDPRGTRAAAGSRMRLCPDCPSTLEARDRFFTDGLSQHLLLALIPFIATLLAVALATRLLDPRRRAVGGAGLLLGVGLGGFLDGIVFHQILQWHGMLSTRVPPVDLAAAKYNMIFDGLFHLLTWGTTVAGILLLLRAGARRTAWTSRLVAGAMLAGWGLFNLIEGVIDHQLLGLHHVRPGDGQAVWDAAFLMSGVILIVVGTGLAVRGRSSEHLLALAR